MAGKNKEHIKAPEYFHVVMNTARNSAPKEAVGVSSYSGKEAIAEFQRLTENNADTEAEQQFINEKGELTHDIHDAVAVFVHGKGDPSVHLYFREHFNQPLDE